MSGSGVFISKEGYILTNNPVVEGTQEVKIFLFDGSQAKATIVGTDMFADLAVLKAEGQVPAVAVLGNSDVLNPGETVIAIGSPLGDFKNTVTVGVVSATGQSITPDIAAAYNLPVQWGIYVTEVLAGIPADKASLQQGDIITRIGEVALDETHSFINALFLYKPGDQVAVELVQDGEKLQLQVTLGEM